MHSVPCCSACVIPKPHVQVNMHIQAKQQKYCLLEKSILLLALFANTASALRLRAGDAAVPAPAPIDVLKSVDSPSAEPTEWNPKNIVGLIGIILVVISLFLSFICVGRMRTKSVRLRVSRVSISKRTEPAPTAAVTTAVIKINAENPSHFVIPVVEEDSGVPNPESVSKCLFDVDALSFDTTTFSLIIREGNIPVHFETIKGKLLSKGSPVETGGRERRVELGKMQDNEGRKISIWYEITT